ncbi:unnamed protein product [Paramecium sonneborni]|uniref:Uncharacterized protein n=1 Tax=Paramecium sonneborni TaxID=65129 RepID=A0A8S1K9I1_9CILI|nr:unnamed protein product [Paramecium sonneborni]
MEIILQIVNEINKSQSKGQDLMIEQFLVGYLIGTGEIKSVEEVNNLIQQLSSIKKRMDDGEISSFSRDYFINQKLKGLELLGGQFQNIKQVKKQINRQIIQDNDPSNIKKNDDQEQNTQEIEKSKLNQQNIKQKEDIEEKNNAFLKQSQKNYNARISKVVQNSKVNQKQNQQ